MRKQLLSTLLVLLVLVLSGCRMYGDYGAEQASYDQIATINTQFSQDFERAKGDLEILKKAVGTDSDLKMALGQYEALLAKHEEMILHHSKLAQSLEVKTGILGKLSTSYRDLNRALGYIIAEQSSMHKHYNDFAARLLKDDAQRVVVEDEQSRYQIAPPFYERIRFAIAERSISDALDLRAGS